MSSAPTGPPSRSLRVVTHLGRIAAFLVSVVVAIVLITSIWWRLVPERDIDVLVYDQTVPVGEDADRAMLQQLLDHHHVDFEQSDYVGSEPGGTAPHGTWPSEKPDLIVLADVYGVYLDESGRASDYGDTLATDPFSQAQADDLQQWIEAGTPAYGEFALVTEPTPGPIGEIFEDSFGFRALPWTGRSVEELRDVAPKIKELGPDPWPYSGPGIIFVTSPVSGRFPAPKLVVLTPGMLDRWLPRVVGGPPGAIPGESTFSRWFGLVRPQDGATVDAWFEIHVNAEGAKVLGEAGLPTRFPALIRNERTLYFAGDGLDDDTPFRLKHVQGGALFTRLVTGREFRFAYQILEPSIAWLLEQPPVEVPTGVD